MPALAVEGLTLERLAARTLNQLADVNAGSPASGNVLAWNAGTGKWEPTSSSAPGAHQLDGATHTVSGLTTGHVLTALSPTTFGFAALPAAGGHALLSSTHTDTTAATVVRGDLIVGDGTPKWVRLPKGTSGYFLKAGASDVAWAAHGLTYTDVGAAASSHAHAWSDLTSGKPTTLSGYGITDAATATHTHAGVYADASHPLIASHTASGLTAGHVLRATAGTTFAFGAIQSGDLPSHNHDPATIVRTGAYCLTIDVGGTNNNSYTVGRFLAYDGGGLTSSAYDSSSFAAVGHTHAGTYLGVAATAADSDKLDGQHGAYYATSGHTHAFADLTSKPTTRAGYGITDAAASSHSHDPTDIVRTSAYPLTITVGGTNCASYTVGAFLAYDGAGLTSSIYSAGSFATAGHDHAGMYAPASHTHAWSALTSGVPTTLAGYGITDAAAASHTHAFSTLTSKPTTLSGYGITDAAAATHNHSTADLTSGILDVSRGGTGSNTVAAGDLMVGASSVAWTQLGHPGAVTRFLKASPAAAVSWATITASDVGAEASGAVSTHAALTTGVHGLAITAGQTLTVTTGGTLGSAAYTASSAYAAATHYHSGADLTSGTVTATRGGTGAATTGAAGSLLVGQGSAWGEYAHPGAVTRFLKASPASVVAWATISAGDVGLGNVTNVAQEPALGNPASNGYALVSTTGGTRSWAAVVTGGPYAAETHYHSGADLTSGTVTALRGGTGSATTGASGSLLLGVGSAWSEMAHPGSVTRFLKASPASSVAWSTLAWSDITSGTPTTLAGYGITDAASSSHSHATYWKHVTSGYGSANVTVGTTAPGSPSQGDIWIDTN